MPKPADDDLMDLVHSTPWYHRIDLPGGLTTPGRVARNPVIASFLDTIDFKGKTVLDIGCWDGLWSFEAEERGANLVVATDDTSQRPLGDSPSFEIARRLRKSSVIYHSDVPVYDIERLGRGDFDVVLFLGIYYHLKHPLYALSKIRRVCKENALLLVEGPAFRSRTRSYARFYYDRWHRGDASNWWVPSRRCLREMIECSFFRITREAATTNVRPVKWTGQPFACIEAAGRVLFNSLYPKRYILQASAVRGVDQNYFFPDTDLAPFDERDYASRATGDRRQAGNLGDRLASWAKTRSKA